MPESLGRRLTRDSIAAVSRMMLLFPLSYFRDLASSFCASLSLIFIFTGTISIHPIFAVVPLPRCLSQCMHRYTITWVCRAFCVKQTSPIPSCNTPSNRTTFIDMFGVVRLWRSVYILTFFRKCCVFFFIVSVLVKSREMQPMKLLILVFLRWLIANFAKGTLSLFGSVVYFAVCVRARMCVYFVSLIFFLFEWQIKCVE